MGQLPPNMFDVNFLFFTSDPFLSDGIFKADPSLIILDQPRANKDPFSVGMDPFSAARWLYTARRTDPHGAGHSRGPVPSF